MQVPGGIFQQCRIDRLAKIRNRKLVRNIGTLITLFNSNNCICINSVSVVTVYYEAEKFTDYIYVDFHATNIASVVSITCTKQLTKCTKVLMELHIICTICLP